MEIKVRELVGIVSIFVSIFTIAIALTIWSVPLYQFSLKHLNIPKQVGLTFQQILDNYYVLLKYLHLPWIRTLTLPNFPVSTSGALHFYEVKILFYINYSLLFVSASMSIFYLRKLKKVKGFWRLIQPFKIAIFVPFVLLLVLVVDFDWMFVMFHKLLFNNEAWLFDATTDPIILVLPQEFFMYSFILAFIYIEAFFIGGYFYFKKKTYKQH